MCLFGSCCPPGDDMNVEVWIGSVDNQSTRKNNKMKVNKKEKGN